MGKPIDEVAKKLFLGIGSSLYEALAIVLDHEKRLQMLEEPNIEPNIEPNVEIELLEIAAYIKAMKDPKKKLLATTSLRQLCQDLGISLED